MMDTAAIESSHEVVGVQLAGSINTEFAVAHIETSFRAPCGRRLVSSISGTIARSVGGVTGCPGFVPTMIACGVLSGCISVLCPHSSQNPDKDVQYHVFAACVGEHFPWKVDLDTMMTISEAVCLTAVAFTLPSVRRVLRDGHLEQLGADRLAVVSQLPSVLFAPQGLVESSVGLVQSLSSEAMHAQVEHAVPDAVLREGLLGEGLIGAVSSRASERATAALTNATPGCVSVLRRGCIRVSVNIGLLAYMCFVCVWPGFGLWLEISIRIGDHTVETLRHGLDPGQWLWCACQTMRMPIIVIVLPLAIFWLMTLLAAANAATREVVALTLIAKTTDLTSEAWKDVEAKAAHVVAKILPTLAAGWNDGIIAMCVIFWALAFKTVATLLLRHVVHGDYSTNWAVGMALGATAAIAAPALVLWTCAGITTQCGTFLHVLNEKRVELLSDEAHVKIAKVEAILHNFNAKQGAGFMVFGTVVSQQSLRKQLGALLGLSVTAMTTIMATTQQAEEGQGNHMCSASKEQVSIVRAVFANESCIYNQTISEILQRAQN